MVAKVLYSRVAREKGKVTVNVEHVEHVNWLAAKGGWLACSLHVYHD